MKKTRIARSMLLLLSLVFAIPAIGGDALSLRRLPPPGEGPSDPQLRSFLATLRAAVRQRDADALKGLLASDIKLTFGPPPKAPPEEVLQLANPDSRVWVKLQTMLELGGAYPVPARNVYCVPYPYAAFPDDIDPYNHQVVIEPAVSARAAPDADAPVVATLDHAIVRTDYGAQPPVKDDRGGEWVRIYLGETAAYVSAETLRRPGGSRACFKKRAGRWLITHLTMVGG